MPLRRCRLRIPFTQVEQRSTQLQFVHHAPPVHLAAAQQTQRHEVAAGANRARQLQSVFSADAVDSGAGAKVGHLRQLRRLNNAPGAGGQQRRAMSEVTHHHRQTNATQRRQLRQQQADGGAAAVEQQHLAGVER